MSENDGGPAFPVPTISNGMSLRDWLAGLAMQALIPAYYGGKVYVEKVAGDAYRMADAMLAEGGKR